MFTIQYTKDDGGSDVVRQCYRLHEQNPWPCPDSVVLGEDEKIRRVNEAIYYKRRGVSYGIIWLTTVAVTQDLLSGMQVAP